MTAQPGADAKEKERREWKRSFACAECLAPVNALQFSAEHNEFRCPRHLTPAGATEKCCCDNPKLGKPDGPWWCPAHGSKKPEGATERCGVCGKTLSTPFPNGSPENYHAVIGGHPFTPEGATERRCNYGPGCWSYRDSPDKPVREVHAPTCPAFPPEAASAEAGAELVYWHRLKAKRWEVCPDQNDGCHLAVHELRPTPEAASADEVGVSGPCGEVRGARCTTPEHWTPSRPERGEPKCDCGIAKYHPKRVGEPRVPTAEWDQITLSVQTPGHSVHGEYVRLDERAVVVRLDGRAVVVEHWLDGAFRPCNGAASCPHEQRRILLLPVKP